jgi:hypothetical protein
MNVNPAWLRAAIVAALAVLVPGGHGQDTRSVTASLQAESDNHRLVLVGKNLTWERVRGFGLIVEHTTDMTGAVRAAVTDTSARVEPTSDGFLLDLGPSGGMGQGNDGVVSLALSSGKVASARLRVEGEAVSGFCLNPVLGEWGSDSPLSRYVAAREEVMLNAADFPTSPVFSLEGGHLLLTVTGASWNDVQAITWRRVEGKDRTSVLREALSSGTARAAPTADGFFLEMDDADLPEGEVALTLDTGAVVASPITVRR